MEAVAASALVVVPSSTAPRAATITIRLTELLSCAERSAILAASSAPFVAGFTIATAIRFRPSADIDSQWVLRGASSAVASAELAPRG